jgi:hypothetical protein
MVEAQLTELQRVGDLDVFEESLLGLEVGLARWALERDELAQLFEVIFAANKEGARAQLDIAPCGWRFVIKTKGRIRLHLLGGTDDHCVQSCFADCTILIL